MMVNNGRYPCKTDIFVVPQPISFVDTSSSSNDDPDPFNTDNLCDIA